MTGADRRHVLVIATQCRSMSTLAALEPAARELADALRNPSIGGCDPGLPGGESVLHGELTVPDIEAAVRTSISRAADKGATLVLALLGHGFTPGDDPTLYLMARDSKSGDRSSGVDVGRLVGEAADHTGVKGVFAIVDACDAAGAIPPASTLTIGSSSGKTRLALLMAAAVNQPAYDMAMSRRLARLMDAGLARSDPHLCLTEITLELREHITQQSITHFFYDGSDSCVPLWLSRNRHAKANMSPLGPHGTVELNTALAPLNLGGLVGPGWTLVDLYRLHQEIAQAEPGTARTRAASLVERLILAHRTAAFLRSFMPAALTGPRLRQAVAALNMAVSDDQPVGDLQTEIDAAEYVARNAPISRGACGKALTRFVVELADDAGRNLDEPELRHWATEINTLVALNDAVHDRRKRRVERQLRLIVSLHYALADDWPEQIGAWLLHDQAVYEHENFDCSGSDRPGTETALANAVDWAEDHADALGLPLRRIEVAMPTGLLLQWRPEESPYERRLGVDYDVLPRWSRWLERLPDTRRAIRSARRRLTEIASITEGCRLDWIPAGQAVEQHRLDEEFRNGVYRRGVGLLASPDRNEKLFELLLRFAPIVVWPQSASAGPEHQKRVEDSWNELPLGFLHAYRARWRDQSCDPVADLRAVWDDEEWLAFCDALLPPRGYKTRST
ncbi:hypothetical protein [Actinomadura sp. 7K507]|uniref:vWA-MoxR associated conflict system protein n=1 Tax=Actinomadura sp. 7K507 TaxID=2530365 RepID=UPI001046D6C0|nr:hypothetical protein [Actinomadura sp. 7K507]TDC89579.1 hypothetical protein E1285_16230 [Actinomadura sp. 7K507]